MADVPNHPLTANVGHPAECTLSIAMGCTGVSSHQKKQQPKKCRFLAIAISRPHFPFLTIRP